MMRCPVERINEIETAVKEPFGCYGLRVIVHGPDCEEKQAKYLVHGWDDVYWVETIDQVLGIIRQDLERDPEKAEQRDDPRYMLSQIERLTWEGHVLRRALIASGADMDKIDTGNEAWMAEKKEGP